jgi:alpha-glucosidase (family GH31 glycosyl hydrolase)
MPVIIENVKTLDRPKSKTKTERANLNPPVPVPKNIHKPDVLANIENCLIETALGNAKTTTIEKDGNGAIISETVEQIPPNPEFLMWLLCNSDPSKWQNPSYLIAMADTDRIGNVMNTNQNLQIKARNAEENFTVLQRSDNKYKEETAGELRKLRSENERLTNANTQYQVSLEQKTTALNRMELDHQVWAAELNLARAKSKV